MNLTLDHNVVIDLANRSPNVERLQALLSAGLHNAHVVEVGASELRESGLKPDRYDHFEELLGAAGLAAVPRLKPPLVWGFGMWEHTVWPSDEMIQRDRDITNILFGAAQDAEFGTKAWWNRKCDVLSMWCHLQYKNEIFVTTDRNFHKASKKPRLLKLGAGSIVRPEEL